uniref:Endonuclease/exonuclease/phosphatase domain-containing protein n=1 Tax=Oryza brachyantha TaxID=4533 RepID=J3LYS3_ORYBR
MTRRRASIPIDFAPRRSPRISSQGTGKHVHSISKTQKLIMKKLGFTEEEENVSHDDISRYLSSFSNPLSPNHVRALAELLQVEVGGADGLEAFQPLVQSPARPVHGVAILWNFLSEFVALPAEQTRGGIVVAWKPDMFDATPIHLGSWSVSVCMTARHGGDSWLLTSVYGPQREEDKLLFLHELSHVRGLSDLPWVISGDFNMIAQATDKNNSRINRRLMNAFKNKINELELRELYLFGRSDLQSQRSRRFRFENLWIKLPGFEEVVRQDWQAPVFAADAFSLLHIKMARLSRTLTKWGQRRITGLRLQLQMATEIVLRLDMAQDERQLTEAEWQLRAVLKGRVLALASLERIRLRQRAKVEALRPGEASQAYFHLKIQSRRRKLFIPRLEFNGNIATTQPDLQRVAQQYF